MLPVTDIDPRLAKTAPKREWPNCRPRDAASLIVVDGKGAQPRVLMGRRHERHVFMPNLFVFPGGRVDAADYRIGAADALHPDVHRKLHFDAKGRASSKRAQALALAAIRETFEEAGLLLGKKGEPPRASRSPAWRAFHAHGVVPKLGSLRFVARAITPPGRRRRYDTRFFCVDAQEIALEAAPLDGELDELRWLTLDETKTIEAPTITRVILEEFLARIDGRGLPRTDWDVPYYAMRRGRFERTII